MKLTNSVHLVIAIYSEFQLFSLLRLVPSYYKHELLESVVISDKPLREFNIPHSTFL
jgi:hypothetical protein